MKEITEEKKLLAGLVDFIADHFGNEVEVVLHDLREDNSPNSIIYIRNGHVTGRQIGDCASKHGMQAVSGEEHDGNLINEVIYTEEGKILKGSSYNIKDNNGKLIGLICINQDITNAVQFQNYLLKQNGFQLKQSSSMDVNEALSSVIQEAFLSVGKHPSAMTKEDKLSFIKFLDDKGAFLISKSGPKVCETLNISKFTLYNYLDSVRNGGDGQTT